MAKVGNYKGRKRGALDLKQRSVINAQIAADILDVYNMLGGPAFLYTWAKNNETAFINGPLARLMPAPPKAEGDGDLNVQMNFLGADNELEAARRVAFALARGMHLQGQQPAIEPVKEDE